MKKTLIFGHVGFNSVAHSIAKALKTDFNDTIVVNNIEAKNIVNQINEPMIINEYDTQIFTTSPKIKDFPRNKFIDKPKYNHKRR